MINNIPACILCGGKSSRFNSDKALAKLGGIPMIERVAKNLKEIFSDVFLIGGKPEYRYLEYENIPDLYADLGPIGGIYSALKTLRFEKIFVIACDMPFINSEIICKLLNYKSSKSIIIAETDCRRHYLCGLYSKTILPALEDMLNNKIKEESLSMRALLERCAYDKVNFEDERIFANINYESELIELKK